MTLDKPTPRSREDTSAPTDEWYRQLALKAQYDEGFKKFMGVEMQDLDQAILPLVYILWKKQIVKTQSSCSGHIGERLLEAGRSTSKENFVHQPGVILFSDIDPNRTKKFLDIILDLKQHYPFIQFQKSDGARSQFPHMLLLSMNDLLVPRSADAAPSAIPSKEVPIIPAQKRLQEIYSIWKEIAVRVREIDT